MTKAWSCDSAPLPCVPVCGIVASTNRATHPSVTTCRVLGILLGLLYVQFLAFFRYDPRDESADPTEVNDFHWICGETFAGWYHPERDPTSSADIATQRQWGCFVAKQVEGPSVGKKYNEGGEVDDSSSHEEPVLSPTSFQFAESGRSLHSHRAPAHLSGMSPMQFSAAEDGLLLRQSGGLRRRNSGSRQWSVTFDPSFIEMVNRDESTQWSARAHRHLQGMSEQEAKRRLGVSRSGKSMRFQLDAGRRGATEDDETAGPGAENLPRTLDWRNIEQGDLMTPVADQGDCGSCFAMSAADAVSMRRRIAQALHRIGDAGSEGDGDNASSHVDAPRTLAEVLAVLKKHPRLREPWEKYGGQPMLDDKEPTDVSPQSAVSCDEYNQGCDGGYPYLVGKFGHDFGFASASCAAYDPAHTQCTMVAEACGGWNEEERGEDASSEGSGMARADGLVGYLGIDRYHVKGVEYVGGWYGACTEQKLKEALWRGPVAVVLYAPGEWFYYDRGIFNTGATPPEYQDKKGASRWEKSNHAVVCVGYGEEKTEHGVEPYWIIKNTWSSSWGMHGYIYLKRGVDMLAVESSAVEIFV